MRVTPKGMSNAIHDIVNEVQKIKAVEIRLMKIRERLLECIENNNNDNNKNNKK